MCENLIAKGNLEKPIILWNRTTQRAIDLSQRVGYSTVIESLGDVVKRSDVLWSCLSDETAVMESFNWLLASDVKGKLFVESSTISPTATNILADRVISAGADFVAVPGTCFDPSFHNVQEGLLIL